MKRRLLVLWMAMVVGMALLSMCGGARVGYQGGYDTAYRGQARGGYSAGGGSAVPDTFRIWNHHWKYPNTAAKTAGYVYTDTTRYTTINRAANGQNIRWGWINRALPDSVQASASAVSDYQNWTRSNGNTTQDDFTWHASQRLFFVWMTANGLKDGQKVEDAYLTVNVSSGAWTLPAGVYLSCVLDTISKDYRILNGNSVGLWGTANNDSSRFKATWNQLVRATPSAWEPVLTDRGDHHDFGPRSATTFGPGAGAAQGTPLRFDVKDAVQQALDNGESERGFLFVIYAYSSNSNTTAWDFVAGNAASGVAAGKGNPTFTATTTSRRGPKPWNGQRVPVTIQFDDSYDVQVGYYRALTDSGHVFNAAACSTNFAARDWLDSLYTLDPASIYFMNHTKTHASIGSVSGSALYAELSRTWFPALITADIDTSAIVDFSLAGGAGSPVIDAEAVEALYDFGYRSMRSGGFDWMAAPGFNHDSFLSWDAPVNRYQIRSVAAEYIFGYPGGWAGNHLAAASEAQIADELGDFVDLYYTNYGKAALVIYAHWYDPGDDATASWVSEANLRYFIGLTNRLNSCQIMPHRDVISMRLAGAQFLTPEQVSVAAGVTADSNQVQAVAADQDSIYDLGGHSNLLKMWIDVPRSSAAAQMSDVIDPAAPTLSLAFGSDNVAYIQWSASTSEDVQYYNVYRYFDGASAVKIGTSTSANYFDNTAINGSPHNYYVTAVDRAGNESVASSTMTTTPGTIISVGRPAYYALWFQDPGASLSSAQLDSLAAFDAIVTGPFAMEGAASEPAYTDMLAGLRSRNPDIIVLQYAHPWVTRTDGQGADRSPYKRMKSYADTGTSGADSLGYVCNTAGQIVRGSQYPLTRHINFMRAGAADSVAFIWAEAYDKISRLSGEYTGLFIDDVTSSPTMTVYDALASGDDSQALTIFDADNDNTVFGSDADEKAALLAYYETFTRALRREFAERGLPNRLIVANSSLGRAASPSQTALDVFSLLDGNMIEGPNMWFPGNAASDTTWDRAFAVNELMTHAQVAPSMQMFQVRADSNIAYMTEVLALANDSWVCSNDGYGEAGYGGSKIASMVRRLPVPGTPNGYDIAEGGAGPDTLTATWSNYTARMLLQRNASAPDDTFAVWPYIIAAGTDTISRSLYWERAGEEGAPPVAQSQILTGDRMLTLAIGAGVGDYVPSDFSHFLIAREYKISSTAYYDTFTVDPDTLDSVYGSTGSWWWYDTGLTNGRQYKYKVFSVDVLSNVGTPAPQVTQTPNDNTPPAVPSGLVASGGDGFVDIDWTFPITAADFAYFRLWRALGDGAFALHDSVTISAHQDSTAISGQDYSYYIVALDDDGNASAPSDTVTGGWIGSSGSNQPPRNVVAISNQSAGKTAVVIYPPLDTTGLTSFTVYRGPIASIFTATDTTACVVYKRGLAPDGYNGHIFIDPWSNTDPDSAFQYTATALYSGVRSPKYAVAQAALSNGGFAATTPTLGAFGNGTNILLVVGSVAGADSTRVYRGTGAGTQTSLASINALDNPYTDTTAAANTDYWYKVRQYDVATAQWSNYSAVSGPVRWTSVPSGDPAISGVTGGSLSHGETVTISGTNFGFKSQGPPLIWETFESGSNGQLVRDVVGWQPYSENRGGAIYSTLLSHGGANSVYSDALVYGDYFGSNKATVEGAHDILFSSCWWRTNNVTVGDDRGLIKLTRFSTTENWYQGRGVPFISGMSAGSGGGGSQSPQVGYYNSSAVEVYTNVGPGGAYLSAPFNAWTRVDLASQLSTAGASDGWIWGAITGPTSRSVKAGYSIATRGSGQTFQFKGILLPTMSTNQYAATPYGDYQLYCDDVYVDNTLARVEIGNESTYDECTHLEIQIPSAWSATSVTINANTGSFANGAAYLFVIDEDGTASAGQAITISN